jgi:hypothetical protein
MGLAHIFEVVTRETPDEPGSKPAVTQARKLQVPLGLEFEMDQYTLDLTCLTHRTDVLPALVILGATRDHPLEIPSVFGVHPRISFADPELILIGSR